MPVERPLLIRPVRADEWSRWRDARLRMLRESPRFFSTRWEDAALEPDSYWRDWVEVAAAGETRALFAAVEPDTPDGPWLGTVGCFKRIDPDETQLTSMWVDRSTRGQGLARSLVHAVASWAVAHSSTTVVLFVQEANIPARRLYDELGFEATGARERLVGRRGFKLILSAPAAGLVATGKRRDEQRQSP